MQASSSSSSRPRQADSQESHPQGSSDGVSAPRADSRRRRFTRTISLEDLSKRVKAILHKWDSEGIPAANTGDSRLERYFLSEEPSTIGHYRPYRRQKPDAPPKPRFPRKEQHPSCLRITTYEPLDLPEPKSLPLTSTSQLKPVPFLLPHTSTYKSLVRSPRGIPAPPGQWEARASLRERVFGESFCRQFDRVGI